MIVIRDGYTRVAYEYLKKTGGAWCTVNDIVDSLLKSGEVVLPPKHPVVAITPREYVRSQIFYVLKWLQENDIVERTFCNTEAGHRAYAYRTAEK